MNKLWRVFGAIILAAIVAGGLLASQPQKAAAPNQPTVTTTSPALTALAKLQVKPATSGAGYTRQQFGGAWASEGSCNMRDKILARDLTNVTYKDSTCEVETGILSDPYTGKSIHFQRGPSTSSLVQIDHVVAIGDAWITGAQQISLSSREQMYNDPLELLAVDGTANDDKGDSDASEWLPPNTSFDCRYVARQIAIKLKYHLWVTPPEHDAMQHTLASCPSQVLPAAG